MAAHSFFSIKLRLGWEKLQDWGKRPSELSEAFVRLGGYIGEKEPLFHRRISKDAQISKLLVEVFASEVCESEGNIKFNKSFECFDFLAAGNVELEINLLPGATGLDKRKLVQKAQNLLSVSNELFGPERISYHPITIDFIKNIHKKVVRHLNISSDFRTRPAKPSGSNFLYAAPNQ